MTRRSVMRKRNPVRMTRAAKIKAAMMLYERFHLDEPEFIDELRLDLPTACVAIGVCDAVEYTTVRDGVVEAYKHTFHADEPEKRPILAASYDGSQLYILGGQYRFTERGIENIE